ncbi:hypothetical protein Achl_4369 (plasmid) [Pseudarthrobacter chlorophenolicus A6]|uniref:Uncharacterized protein n=1 Tax=Pseudarthrobacter chlorophenolicus (strain ATCC 700700 / DSM 12829 / CIP 107037 / JCM 12360 / KCTC 9906 / NCIMB 13794 / A6) TaxID=452863 RepID=B8HIS3_PSECP|nr:hypothetical protein [Pseudarthrobacter chlorophenolicus]ACL42320.1 hypothetical protein Achl_4369 [Pseudarthrobacter chlorophenolicus A6]SDQ16452.1 hypothetical protein SAMN04489738_0426 [Pseudarthrobacter chlorophenolicus]
MLELLDFCLAMDHLGSMLLLLIVGAVFAAVRHSERVKPARGRRDG